MEHTPVLVFAASATRARLTLLGTLLVLGIILRVLHVDWWGVGLIAALIALSGALPLGSGGLRKVVVYPQSVTFEFASFGRRVRRTEDRARVMGRYQPTVGPKGVSLMVLALTDTTTNESIAEVQPDVTGWKEQDLVALAKVLDQPISEPSATPT